MSSQKAWLIALITITLATWLVTLFLFLSRSASSTVAQAQQLDSDLYQISAGQTQVFDLVALTAAGNDIRFSFQLDPAQGTNNPVMTWTNATNPNCSGDVAT